MIKFLLIITCISVILAEFNFDEEWTFFKQKYGRLHFSLLQNGAEIHPMLN